MSHEHQQQQQQYTHDQFSSQARNGPNLSLPYSDGGSLNVDSSSHFYTTTTTTTSTTQQAPSTLYSSSSSPNTTSNTSSPLHHTLQTPNNPYIPTTTDRPKNPWNLPSAASSFISTDLSGSTAYQPSISDKRRLIHSWSSRPQSSLMDPNDQQFTAIELHNQMNNNNNTAQSRNTFGNTTDTTTNDLASLSPTTTPPNKTRPASVYSQSGGVRTTRKTKQGFWATIKPRKFTFRPEGITRPKKANSFGNKKAKFSNERTMVHWIKSAMLMGSLAMTLLSFGENNLTPYIGVALLVICLMTLIYSNTVFQVRMEWLNMRRDDVQYYDRVAPTILAFLVMITFGFNGVVMYTGEYHTNKMFLKPFGM